MTMLPIQGPATIAGIADSLFQAVLDGKVTGETRVTYVSISLNERDKTFTANIYCPKESE